MAVIQRHGAAVVLIVNIMVNGNSRGCCSPEKLNEKKVKDSCLLFCFASLFYCHGYYAGTGCFYSLPHSCDLAALLLPWGR